MNNSQENCLEETKCIIGGLLISNPLRCTIRQLCKDFIAMIGYPIPARDLGFENPEEFLRSIPDTVKISGFGQNAEVQGVINKKSRHINMMVMKQRKNVPSHKRGLIRKATRENNFRKQTKAPLPIVGEAGCSNYISKNSASGFSSEKNLLGGHYQTNSRNNVNFTKQSKASLPIIGEASCSNYISKNSDSDFSSEENLLGGHYQSYSKHNVNFTKQTPLPIVGEASCSNFIPKNSVNGFSSEEDLLGGHYEREFHSSDEDLHEENPQDQLADVCTQLSHFNVEEEINYNCLVLTQVQNNLKQLISRHPDGILSTKLLQAYKNTFGKDLDYRSFKYRSVIEMCASLPNIFKFVQCSSDDYLLYDKNLPQPALDQYINGSKYSQYEKVAEACLYEELGPCDVDLTAFIPSDVMQLTDTIPRYFPANLEMGNYLDVAMAEIYDLSKFWVYLRNGRLSKMTNDLQTFFAHKTDHYLVPEQLLAEGLYCVIKYSGMYHRAVVVNLLKTHANFVRVLCIDFGTVENVRTDEIWFMPKQFGKLPTQAIRCRLAMIVPPVKNTAWSAAAINQFKKLTFKDDLLANVTRIDRENLILDLYLADISNVDNIYYLNEVLIDGGHAVYSDQERAEGPVGSFKQNVRNLHLYPDFVEIEQGFAATTDEMNYLLLHKVPLHHYIPQYFQMELEDENMEDIQLDFRISNDVPCPDEDYYYSLNVGNDYPCLLEDIIEDIREVLDEYPEDYKLSKNCKNDLRDSACSLTTRRRQLLLSKVDNSAEIVRKNTNPFLNGSLYEDDFVQRYSTNPFL